MRDYLRISAHLALVAVCLLSTTRGATVVTSANTVVCKLPNDVVRVTGTARVQVSGTWEGSISVTGEIREHNTLSSCFSFNGAVLQTFQKTWDPALPGTTYIHGGTISTGCGQKFFKTGMSALISPTVVGSTSATSSCVEGDCEEPEPCHPGEEECF